MWVLRWSLEAVHSLTYQAKLKYALNLPISENGIWWTIKLLQCYKDPRQYISVGQWWSNRVTLLIHTRCMSKWHLSEKLSFDHDPPPPPFLTDSPSRQRMLQLYSYMAWYAYFDSWAQLIAYKHDTKVVLALLTCLKWEWRQACH